MRYIRISLIFLVVICCATVVYLSYTYIHRIELHQLSADDLIPEDAVFVYQSDKIVDDWNRLSATSILWENLRSNHLLAGFMESASVADSLVTNNTELEKIVNDRVFSLSMHYSDQKKSYLFLLQLKPEDDPDDVLELIAKTFPEDWQNTQTNISDKSFKVFTKDDERIFAGSFRNMIVLSKSEKLIVETLLVKPEQSKKTLKSLTKSVGHGFDINGNLYVNFRLLNYFLKNNFDRSLLVDLKLENWMASDLLVKPKTILLNGVFENDKKGLMYQLSDLPNRKMEITQFIPSDVSGFVRISLPEKNKLASNLCLADSADLVEHINEINVRTGVDIQYHLLSWLGNEAGVFQEREGNRVWVYPASIVETALLDKIGDYCTLISRFYDQKIDSSEYKGFDIFKSALPFGYQNIHSNLFKMPEMVWMASREDVVYIAESKQTLIGAINSLKAGTLYNNPHFIERNANFMSSESAFYIYGKPFLLGEIAAEYFGEGFKNVIIENHSFFSNLTYCGIQIISGKDQMPFNAVAYYDASDLQSSEFLWDTELPAKMTGSPHIIYNHRSKSKNILVQDENNMIYLLTNTGSIQWKKQLDGQIMDHVEQIDIYSNSKLQMVCNTSTSLYVIDVLGRDVKGFPIKLPKKATAPFQVFDYENKNKYRILIPAGTSILNYDKEGQKVNGWNFEGSKKKLTGRIYHSIINSRDILFTYDVDGNLYYLNRRGEAREFDDIRIIRKARRFNNSALYFEKSNSLVTSKIIYMDSTGHVMISYLGGTSDSLEIMAPSPNKQLYYYDVDGDKSGDYVIRTDNQILVYNKNKVLLYSAKTNDITEFYYNETLNGSYSGLRNEPSSTLRVYDKKGNQIGKGKLTSAAGFVADDINKDGELDIIYCSADNHIRAFSTK